MNRNNPLLQKRNDVVRDGKGNLYKILYSKDTEFSSDEYKQVASEFQRETGLYPEKCLIACEYQNIEDTTTQIIGILNVIDAFKGELTDLKGICEKSSVIDGNIIDNTSTEQTNRNNDKERKAILEEAIIYARKIALEKEKKAAEMIIKERKQKRLQINALKRERAEIVKSGGVKEYLLQKLKEDGKASAIKMIIAGPIRFRDTYGKSIMSAILGKKIDDVSKNNFLELIAALGYDLRSEVRNTLSSILGINDMQSLLNCTRKKILKYIDLRVLSAINTTYSKGEWREIIKLGKRIGLKSNDESIKREQEKLALERVIAKAIKRRDTKKRLRQKLQKDKKDSAIKIVVGGPRRFRNTYGKGVITIILGRRISEPTKEVLLETITALGYDLHKEVKNLLSSKLGINNMEDLKNHTRIEILGHIDIKIFHAVNGKYDKNGSRDDIIQLCKKIGLKSDDESIKIEKQTQKVRSLLSGKKIADGISLIKKPAKQLGDILLEIRELLGGGCVNEVTLEDKYLLAKKLSWNTAQEISDRIESHLQQNKGATMYQAIASIGFHEPINIIHEFLPDITRIRRFNPIDVMIAEAKEYLKTKYQIKDGETYKKLKGKLVATLGYTHWGLIMGTPIRNMGSYEKDIIGQRLGLLKAA